MVKYKRYFASIECTPLVPPLAKKLKQILHSIFLPVNCFVSFKLIFMKN